MNEKKFEYCGYVIEITEHPIYHDFEFIIKTADEKTVVGTNTHFIDSYEAAEIEAKMFINDLK